MLAPVASHASPPPRPSRSILIADRDLDDVGPLLEGLRSGIELRILGGDERPADALRRALGEEGVQAVHLLGHGAPGRMVFASGILDAASLEEIPAGIGLGVEVVLYGCRTGAKKAGATLLDAIARHTGAPVRAATHRVGSASKGGCWRLDARRGTPAESIAFSKAATARYPHLLDGDPYATVNPLATSDTSPTIRGSIGNQGALVLYVTVGETQYRLTPTGSTWSLDLPEGTIGPDRTQVSVSVSLFDEADGIWMETDRQSLRYDTSPPYVTFTSPTLTSDTTPTLSGRTEYNSTVTVTVGGATYSIFVPGGPFTPDQAWSLDLGSATPTSGTLSLNPNGPNTVTIQATDHSGESTEPQTITLTIDTVAPTAPTVDLAASSDSGTSGDTITSDTTPTLTGSAEAGSTVTLYASDGTTVLGSATADGSGGWSIASSALAEGVHTLTATATDAIGHVSGVSTPLTVTVDTTPPAAPSAPDLAEASDRGDSAADDLTSDTTPTITGSAAAGSIVTLRDSDGTTVLGSATADGSGGWTITSSALVEGAHTLTATATDAAGNASAASMSLTLTIDATAPAALSAPDLAEASDSGPSSTDDITNDTTPILSGSAEAGSTVTLHGSDGTTVLGSATADGSGRWTLTSSALTEGAHTLTATATDAAGNVSAASAPLTIAIDTTQPAAPSAPDLADASDSGASSTDDLTSDTTPTVTGSAEAGSTVTLYATDGSTVLGSATADGSGRWSITSSALAEGAHTLTATATDAAGNVSAASTALTVTIDTTPPAASSAPDLVDASDSGNSASDDITSDNTPTLTGTAAPDATVRIYDTDNAVLLGTATADGSGAWSYTAATLADGLWSLGASAQDAAGNGQTSVMQSLTITVDTLAGEVLDNDAAADRVTAGAAAGRSVGITARMAGATSYVLTDDAGGRFAIDVTTGVVSVANPGLLAAGSSHAVSVRATDAAGNQAMGAFLIAVADNSPTSPPPPPPPTSAQNVVGTTVTETFGTQSGTPTVTLTIAPPSSSAGTASVTLGSSGGGASMGLVLPAGLAATASGPQQESRPDQAGQQLLDSTSSLLPDDDSDTGNVLRQGISSFVAGAPAGGSVLVRTLTLETGTDGPADPIQITGSSGTGGSTALVLDARSLSGSQINLDSIGFAAVFGTVTLRGGSGANLVVGNSDSQDMLLGADDDTLHGGGGDDIVRSLAGRDRLYGDDGADTVGGGEDDDFLDGGAGDDALYGNQSADTAHGGAGADALHGGRGGDYLAGGDGGDRMAGDLDGDLLFGNRGADSLEGGAGIDVLYGGRDGDLLLGGADADTLYGDLGGDSLNGNEDSDVLHGGDGNDTLRGGRDADALSGDDGADTLFGDLGDDTLSGGPGADLFMLQAGGGNDLVLDFDFRAGDRLGLAEGMTLSIATGLDGFAAVTWTAGGGSGSITLRGVSAQSVDLASWIIP